MVDTDSERQLQARFEQLRADGQLCPCACENCPLRDAAAEIDAEPINEKTATRGAVSSVSLLTSAEAGPVT